MFVCIHTVNTCTDVDARTHFYYCHLKNVPHTQTSLRPIPSWTCKAASGVPPSHRRLSPLVSSFPVHAFQRENSPPSATTGVDSLTPFSRQTQEFRTYHTQSRSTIEPPTTFFRVSRGQCLPHERVVQENRCVWGGGGGGGGGGLSL